MNLILNRFQVQVYDSNEDMIYFGIFEGFSKEEAIRNANKYVQENKASILEEKQFKDFYYPIKFHIND